MSAGANSIMAQDKAKAEKAMRSAEGLPPGVTLLKPDQMKWEKSAVTGLEGVNLLGDPNKAGPYLSLAKWPPNE